MMLSMETRGRAIKVVIVSQSDFNSQCHLLEMHSVLQYPCFDILLFFFFFFFGGKYPSETNPISYIESTH